MNRSRIAALAGWVILVAGIVVWAATWWTSFGLDESSRQQVANSGRTLALLGAILLVGLMVSERKVTTDEAYRLGYDIGYEKGHNDARKMYAARRGGRGDGIQLRAVD